MFPVVLVTKTVIIGAIFAISLLIILSMYMKKKKNSSSKSAPEPSAAWPIIGHLPLLVGSNHNKLPHKTLAALADKYGPVFTLRLGVHRTLVVSSAEIAKELFTINDNAISSRPLFVAGKLLGYNFAMFGIAPYSAYWREMRKIVVVELLSARRLELLKRVGASEIGTSLKELYEVWRARKDEQGKVVVEMKQWFGDLTLNVIVRMISGKRYSGVNASTDNDEYKVRKLQKALGDFMHYLGMFVVRDAVPYMGWLDLGGHEKAMKRTARELDWILDGWLEEHKRNRADSRGESRGDFIDVLLSVLEGKCMGGYDPDTIIKATSLNMIAGGSETTMVTLTWALSLLVNNQHVLKKAQQELDACVGKERVVNDKDMSKLVYLQAIVKETLRLYPPAPLSVPRELINDCMIGGYTIRKGTWLNINLWKIQTDPNIWPDPMEFKPERFLFLTTHKDVDVKGHDFGWLPFGSGRKGCPGMNFGMQMVHTTLATFLHAFHVSTPGNAPVDMSESFGLSNMRATPLHVTVSPRLSSHLYDPQ